MAEPDTTKIVRLEEQMKNVVTEVGEVKNLVREVITKVDALSNLRGEIDNLKGKVDILEKVAATLAEKNTTTAAELRKELSDKDKKDALTSTLQKIVIGGFSALFTYLVIAYFQKG